MDELECAEHIKQLVEIMEKELEHQQNKYDQLLELHSKAIEDNSLHSNGSAY